MRGWWQELVGLVLPVDCAGCGEVRMLVCGECRKALGGAEAGPVRPRARPPGLPEVYAAVGYQGAVRAVLLAHKERGALPLAGPLGRALAAAVREAVVREAAVREGVRREAARSGPEVVLVPVPSARRQVRARGHDPARRIALAASAELRRGGTAARVAPVLRQRRAVADQSGLGARQRRENLAGALEICGGGARAAAGGALVLVDDLITTGATLAEAARAVREAGLPVTAAAVVAAPAESFEAFEKSAARKSRE
ncbi:ComF family protein [Streptomyces sp. NPDC002054]|uniref:ComF family protein n=1 Tax=Streptomyces sp. NPDC002054 TaxID=3154663 RepID=UPI003320CB99